MKAMLLRVGIDTGTDGALAPIFSDGSFEYIPISEGNKDSSEHRTYQNTVGRSGKPLSMYLPERIKHFKMHFDPEFDTFTYGDPTPKRGGRSKIYYSLTPDGLKALEKVNEFNLSLWKGMRELMKDSLI